MASLPLFSYFFAGDDIKGFWKVDLTPVTDAPRNFT